MRLLQDPTILIRVVVCCLGSPAGLTLLQYQALWHLEHLSKCSCRSGAFLQWLHMLGLLLPLPLLPVLLLSLDATAMLPLPEDLLASAAA